MAKIARQKKTREDRRGKASVIGRASPFSLKSDRIRFHFEEKSFPYDGTQLRHLFAYEKFGLLGTSLVAWKGACHVPLDKMIDGEDKFSKSEIRGDLMLHFVGEFFHKDIYFSVALQRLFATMVLRQILKIRPEHFKHFVVSGDDLYYGQKKLSISIASITGFSSMFHFALNIENEGTPVPTVSLSELGVPVKQLVLEVFREFREEYCSLVEATEKILFLS